MLWAEAVAVERDPKTLGVGEAYPVITRIAVLGMSAAAAVKLTPAEAFALLAQASKLVSLSGNFDWKSDTESQVAFLHMSACHDWAHLDGEEQVTQRSPKSAVSLHAWESALDGVSGIPQSKIRVAKVRILNSMGRPSR